MNSILCFTCQNVDQVCDIIWSHHLTESKNYLSATAIISSPVHCLCAHPCAWQTTVLKFDNLSQKCPDPTYFSVNVVKTRSSKGPEFLGKALVVKMCLKKWFKWSVVQPCDVRKLWEMWLSKDQKLMETHFSEMLQAPAAWRPKKRQPQSLICSDTATFLLVSLRNLFWHSAFSANSDYINKYRQD